MKIEKPISKTKCKYFDTLYNIVYTSNGIFFHRIFCVCNNLLNFLEIVCYIIGAITYWTIRERW